LVESDERLVIVAGTEFQDGVIDVDVDLVPGRPSSPACSSTI